MKVALHTKIGIGIILLGVGPLLFAEYMVHAHNWTPLNVQITLKPGEIQLPEFTTDLDARYLVSLASDPLRGHDLTVEQCMMGVGSVWNCGDVKQAVDFEWQIISAEGAVIQGGSYEPTSISGAKIGFAEFQGHRNSRQRIVFKVHRDAGDLNSRHPQIMVDAAPETWESLPYLYILSQYWAGIIATLGVLVIVLPLCYRKLM